MIANIRQLRSSTKETIQAIDRGDVVVITKHGKPCAKIIPLQESSSIPGEEETAFGMWKNNQNVSSVTEYIAKVRAPRHAR
jgi:prevent-host-death family protein